MSYGEPLNSVDDLRGRASEDILARIIYDEARGESWAGKQAIAAIVANRKQCKTNEFRNQNTVEDVVLYAGAFDGITYSKNTVLKPDTSSQAWHDGLYIAINSADQDNPIGKCLWFIQNASFENRVIRKNGKEYYQWAGTPEQLIVEKVVIGGHTFFRVENYNF